MFMAAIIGVTVLNLERVIIGSSDVAGDHGVIREVVEYAVVPRLFSVEFDESIFFKGGIA